MSKRLIDTQLIDAVNSLCEYVMQNLTEGWEIELRMSKDDCSCELFDAGGESVHVDHDHGYSQIRAMCKHAEESK